MRCDVYSPNVRNLNLYFGFLENVHLNSEKIVFQFDYWIYINNNIIMATQFGIFVKFFVAKN